MGKKSIGIQVKFLKRRRWISAAVSNVFENNKMRALQHTHPMCQSPICNKLVFLFSETLVLSFLSIECHLILYVTYIIWFFSFSGQPIRVMMVDGIIDAFDRHQRNRNRVDVTHTSRPIDTHIHTTRRFGVGSGGLHIYIWSTRQAEIKSVWSDSVCL